MAEIIALLKDGQKVEINGNYFRAKRLEDDYYDSPCDLCNVDCLCKDDVGDVCTELDFGSKSVWILNLVS